MKKKRRKIMWIIIVSILATAILLVVLFLQFSPQFGGNAGKSEKKIWAKSGLFVDGKFVNQIPTSMDMGFKEGLGVMREFMKKDPIRKPQKPMPIQKTTPEVFTSDTSIQLLWYGHSTFLYKIYNRTILIDPMFGESPSPLPMFGTKRYYDTLPLPISELPLIDVVLLSHDHYDHLDYGSIKAIQSKVGQFFVPLGVGAHLRSWGVKPGKIHELSWGDSSSVDGIILACVPARHFSGRGLSDRNSTLWCGWVINSPEYKLFFSGDGGYGPHFKEIGEQYGPFDLALLECGQYNYRWEAIHMMPEQTIQAGLDVKAKSIMPIHWGAFTLSLHSWTDPVERAVAEADRKQIAITTPKIGEVVNLQKEEYPKNHWWVY